MFETDHAKPSMPLLGQDGNIFAILGQASRLLKASGQDAQAKEMAERVYASQSYAEALHIISEYVETELSSSHSTPKTTKKKEKNVYER